MKERKKEMEERKHERLLSKRATRSDLQRNVSREEITNNRCGQRTNKQEFLKSHLTQFGLSFSNVLLTLPSSYIFIKILYKWYLDKSREEVAISYT